MEEIIIDGVNVAGCRLYDYGICDSEMAEDLNCEKNSDCYYKQLKRLEQENSELKEENENLEYELENMQGFELLQELKYDLENNKRWLRDCQLHSETYIRQRDKYKQALEEIRGICKSSKESSCDECPICDDCEELCIDDDNLQNIIIDKINEVLEK